MSPQFYERTCERSKNNQGCQHKNIKSHRAVQSFPVSGWNCCLANPRRQSNINNGKRLFTNKGGKFLSPSIWCGWLQGMCSIVDFVRVKANKFYHSQQPLASHRCYLDKKRNYLDKSLISDQLMTKNSWIALMLD